MSKIRILSDQLANRIAAGEVVERPASAVKELLENSLDAGAGRVIVHVEGDGTRLIRVADDGAGMDQDDVLLCLERHATSKLMEENQLDAIATLGFRGEAMPSIASVSTMTIISRLREAAAGTRAEIRFGVLRDVHEDGCACGTVVEVRSLFGNIPARRKFLKSRRTELMHVEEIVRSQALACPETAFALFVDGRKTIDLPATDAMQRMRDVFCCQGEDLLIVDAASGEGGVAIKGWLLPASSWGGQLRILVNRRPVQDRLIRHAVMDGMKGLLMKGQQPSGALLLELAPELVDINVHPAKREIRFRNAGAVHGAVALAVTEAVGRHQESFRSELFARPEPEKPSASPRFWTASETLAPPVHAAEPRQLPPNRTEAGSLAAFSVETPQEKDRHECLGLRLIGQLLNLYLLCERDEQLVVIDQHAAHERILYQQLRQGYEQRQPASQSLLFPVAVELRAEQADIMDQESETIASLGLEAEFFGGCTWAVKALPALISHLSPQEALSDILDSLAIRSPSASGCLTGGKTPECIDRMLSSLACKAALKAGNRLQPAEMIALLQQMSDSELFSRCPHGRPVLRIFSRQEIERWFRRS